MAAAIVPLETALSGAIGARVRITTAPPTAITVEGTLFTACPITNLVAINTAPSSTPSTGFADSKPEHLAGDYHILPVSRIQSFQLLSLAQSSNASDGHSFTDAVPALHPLDIRALKEREATVVAKLQDREARRGKGVTHEAQELFDRFSRTMPTRWDGTSIIVADAVVVPAPYRVDDCRPLVAGDKAALARVRKVLQVERQKIEFRNASNAIGNTSTFTRNSGAVPSAVPAPSNLSVSAGPGAAGQRKGG
ncbi:hypothetical protein MPDQ_002007 [Monascus purpureus]|uniref:AD domain-containing protein n=1 Tax=Monascus purpureus TaxID=5098 RepID=A0A507R2B6_MONPU|nr:hypothetical protein MPDQ_002007 [Monascus purpureus]BDD56342.1 hypothetical protein MAP00_001809 [Monascus purpureus]